MKLQRLCTIAKVAVGAVADRNNFRLGIEAADIELKNNAVRLTDKAGNVTVVPVSNVAFMVEAS